MVGFPNIETRAAARAASRMVCLLFGLSGVFLVQLCLPGAAGAEQTFEAALSPKDGPETLLRGVEVDASVPGLPELLGFELCSRPARSAEINDYLRRLAEASPRIKVVKYGQTH